jgi:hypothetical protein
MSALDELKRLAYDYDDDERIYIVCTDAADQLAQLNTNNSELTEACEVWLDKYEVLEADNARLQKAVDEAYHVISYYLSGGEIEDRGEHWLKEYGSGK